ncbi:MAG: hypothetical protein AABZ15_04785 [Nitrospirota bacterium]
MNRKDQKTLFRVVIAAVLAVGLGMLTGCGGGGGGGGAAPATAPGAFVLSAPTGTSIVLTPTLTWSSSSGASLYTVQVTTSPTFSIITTFESTTVSTTSIVVSGLSPSTAYYWRVTAYNSVGSTPSTPVSTQFTTKKSGELVWAQTVNPSVGFDDEVYGVAVDANALYAVGYDSDTEKFDDQWRMEKRDLTNGNLMTSFGTAGAVVSNPSATTINSFDDANAITIDSTYMYVVGYDAVPDVATGVSSLTDDEWRIEKRRLDTGEFDTSFGTAGVIVSNPSSSIDEAVALAIDTLYMYVAGYDTTASRGKEWRIEKYLLSTGASVTAFGTNGIITSDPSANSDKALSIAIDETDMYIAGYESAGSGLWQWRIEKRKLDTGSLEALFGSAGVVSIPTTTGDSIIYSIATDTQYLYVAGYVTINVGNTAWQIEKRDKSNGNLTWAVTSNPNPSQYNAPKAIVVDADYIYIAGFESTTSAPFEYEWRIEKRSLSDGSLVAAFATNGVYQSHPSSAISFDDDIWAMSSDADYLYVVGYDSVFGTREWRIEKIVK